MKCTWKDWKGGGLTSWHGISHRDGTDWGISSMKDLGHGTVEASPLCCCECSPDTGTPILVWMWNPGQPLVLCHSWDGGACQSQSHLLVICTMEIILGELNPPKVSACPFEGRSAIDPSSLEIWGRKEHPGVQSHRTDSQWEKYLLQALLRARNSSDSIFSCQSSVSWLHFHSMTWQSSDTVFCCLAQFAKSKYMGIKQILWAWHQRTPRKS